MSMKAPHSPAAVESTGAASTATGIRPADATLLDVLRVQGSLGVADIAAALGVTATAVRQRLERLMTAGLIDRTSDCRGAVRRGRPSHRYQLSDAGRRSAGDNFRDLAIALWREIRGIREPQVRQGMLARVGSTLAGLYRDRVGGETPVGRLEDVAALFRERRIACDVTASTGAGLPVLTAYACPYPELAEQDRGICVAERSMLQELVGANVRLSECRLDGADCCRFSVVAGSGGEANGGR